LCKKSQFKEKDSGSKLLVYYKNDKKKSYDKERRYRYIKMTFMAYRLSFCISIYKRPKIKLLWLDEQVKKLQIVALKMNHLNLFLVELAFALNIKMK
jgi:hypothetical protein